jgi:hypothetical protein
MMAALKQDPKPRLTGIKLDRILDSSNLRRVREGSTQKMDIFVSNEETLAFTQSGQTLDDQKPYSDADLSRPWYKNGVVMVVGLIALGLAVGAYVWFGSGKGTEPSRPEPRFVHHVVSPKPQTKRPENKETHKKEVALRKTKIRPEGHKAVSRPPKPVPPKPRKLEIRPMYSLATGKLKLMSGVDVVLDGKPVGASTKTSGVQVNLAPGRHSLVLKGSKIQKKIVDLDYTRVKSGVFKVKVELSW